MITRQLDYEIYSSSNYKFIVEDNIQKLISKPLTTLSKIIQYMDGTIQIKFGPTSRYSSTQEFLLTRSFTSSTNLNSVNFTPNIPIPVYQQQESPPMSLTHFDMCPFQVNIIHKKNNKKILSPLWALVTPFQLGLIWRTIQCCTLSSSSFSFMSLILNLIIFLSFNKWCRKVSHVSYHVISKWMP